MGIPPNAHNTILYVTKCVVIGTFDIFYVIIGALTIHQL
jgi:hypothetical protein